MDNRTDISLVNTIKLHLEVKFLTKNIWKFHFFRMFEAHLGFHPILCVWGLTLKGWLLSRPFSFLPSGIQLNSNFF